MARRQEEEREKAERARRHEERLEQQREERVQIAMKDYASYSEKRLQKIADGETWSNHCEGGAGGRPPPAGAQDAPDQEK